MVSKQTINKKFLLTAGNYIFFGLILLLLFNPNAKSWMLRQFMAAGLFKAEIKKEDSASHPSSKPVSFSFRNETGNTVSTADLEGKVVFINFWATWCPPCRAEMPALNDLYHQFQNDERLVFLFINEDEDPGKAAFYLQSNSFTMPHVTRAGPVPQEIFSGTLPTTVVLNKEGKIVYRHEGLAKYNTEKFIHQLKALL